MIYTFYSYKGGVGRTLALANLAELFYRAGLHVLVIDWDLASPGIENYFPSLNVQNTLGHPGLMDMLLQYKEYMRQELKDTPFALENPSRYLVPVYSDDFCPGSLHLLTAGRRPLGHNSQYTGAMLTFDWQEFYNVWEGELYLNWLREQFEQIADIILIDCRAGISEMGGVCTYHLADVIVMFCSSDQQNLQGTYEMAQKFTSDKVRKVRIKRPVKVMVVPSRIDEQLPKEQLLRLRYEFVSRFTTQNFSADAGLVTHGDAMWSLRIPQISPSVFTDTSLVNLPTNERYEGIYRAYCLLVETLAQQSPSDSAIHKFVKPGIFQEQIFIGQRFNQPFVVKSEHQDEIQLGSLVKTCCEVNLRPTPGYVSKSLNETIRIKEGVLAKVLDGPQVVDDLLWWFIACKTVEGYNVPSWPQKNFRQLPSDHSSDTYKKNDEIVHEVSQIIYGWVAEKTPNGVTQLQKTDTVSLDQDAQFLVDPRYIEIISVTQNFETANDDVHMQKWMNEEINADTTYSSISRC